MEINPAVDVDVIRSCKMKRRYIVFGVAAFSALSMKAQRTDTAFKKEKLNKTEVAILYGQYIQDGNNSAVTGGIGTEKLTVYAPGFVIKKSLNKNTYGLKGGVDMISSASTDNIDYVVSSASKKDARTYAGLDFTHELNDKLVLSAGTGFSIESDYTSLQVNAGVSSGKKEQTWSWSVDMQFIFDDLRYGRLKAGFKKPYYLIYASELRYRDWYDDYLRRSYNLKLGLSRVINKRMILGLYPEVDYQHGLLATPFHRVYFTDNSLKPENLPDDRFKAFLGIKANYFAGSNTILKNSIDLYADNFGILGMAIENETAFKLNYLLSLSPSLRFYHQQGAKYFSPYQQHLPGELFYTSDYDLSRFNSFKAGMGLRYSPLKRSGRFTFNEVQLRYAWYRRSNGLNAHIISFLFSGDRKG